jgi:RHS repeat-associated protein
VLVTVSDKRTPIDDGTYTTNTLGVYTNVNSTPDGKIDYYTANIVNANDYTPFGSLMTGRKYSAAASKYRYGFNGKENDNDVKGVEGGQQDYGMRIYDPRLGRFLSVDPLKDEFPWNSPYSYAEGDPVNYNDLDGLERAPLPSAANPTPTRPFISSRVPLSNWYVNSKGNLVTRPSLPVSSSTPPGTAGNQGIHRVEGGWYITTPNGGYTEWDTQVDKLNINYVPFQNDFMKRQEAQKKEVTEGLMSLQRNAVGENPTPMPKTLNIELPISSQPSTNIPEKSSQQEKTVTLYRGVHGKHPDLPNAVNGMAVPRGLDGGHDDANKHNEGNNSSIYTSWTTDKQVARLFAGRRGFGGVILTKKFKKSETVKSNDKFKQKEVLIPGVVTGAKVERVKPIKKR